MSGTYEHTELTAEEKANIAEYAQRLESAFLTPEAERDDRQQAMIDSYFRAVDKAVMYGKSGKPTPAPKFPFTTVTFAAAMNRRAAIERARRQQWALITGRALSWADFAELTGKTLQEVFKINHRLHAVGIAQSMRQTARPARLAATGPKRRRRHG